MNAKSLPAGSALRAGASPTGVLPRIAVLATGGTIASIAGDPTATAAYEVGVVGIGSLLDKVAALDRVARVAPEQFSNLNSKDMTPSLWHALATRVGALLADDTIDGVVITHGTDTVEETAYLLHLTLKSRKPVVLTAAMRPASALSADGPLNLLHAVRLAAHPAASGRGVMVVLNHLIHGARDVTKTSTYAVHTFRSNGGGALGWIQDDRVEFERAVLRAHTVHSEFSLPAADAWPAVEIVLSYAGASRTLVDALLASGARGIVVAGSGNGSIGAEMERALSHAARRGVAVVRASRVGSGHVMRNGAADDGALGFVSAGTLNPYKARVLLMLALVRGIDTPADLQACFERY